MDELELRHSALDHIRALDDDMSELEIRTFLGGFDFHGDKVKEPVRIFSGGEKARLALAIVSHSKPNLLLMDEPTNHLDMDMRQALTVALQEFEGAIVLISHDRHLLANTVDEFVLVHDRRVRPFTGDLEDYRKRLFDEPEAEATPDPEPVPKAAGTLRRESQKQARQLKTRLNTIEQRLTRLSGKLADVESRLADASLYTEAGQSPDLQSLLREQLGLKDEIDQLENEWLEASESLESLDASGSR